jgi:hypothetical protein
MTQMDGSRQASSCLAPASAVLEIFEDVGRKRGLFRQALLANGGWWAAAHIKTTSNVH